MSTPRPGDKAWPPEVDADKPVIERLGDPTLLAAAAAQIRRRVIFDHLASGQPVAVFRDGQVVNVPAEELARELESGDY